MIRTATNFGQIDAPDHGAGEQTVLIGLSAAILSVQEERPRVLVVRHNDEADALPFGNFDPLSHRTLESGLRNWVQEQTSVQLGYVEQLYTFGDRGRHLARPGEGPRVVSVGYLALTRTPLERAGVLWRDWYMFFPWEDWREGAPAMIASQVLPSLRHFADAAPNPDSRAIRNDRIRLCFGGGTSGWDEEKVLERYELLYEAGLVVEAQRDRGAVPPGAPIGPLGLSMSFDHRRILATAMGRLRGKIKYRPVVFELMAGEFTLLELQRTVEALSGVRLHKQNFRRLVEAQGLVERTGRMSHKTGGRPAEQFRFRREVLRERPAPGVRYGFGRAIRPQT
ncbi:MAG TPA: hypothetical protein VFW28_11960 [Micropepsaceae bacterium]|nr:hypothetical protein [Micropepsaceae bacterium]